MKKAVRFLAAAMVVMMLAMALAGCGGSSGNEIVIGGVGPLTGTAATYGQSVRNAAQIAVDEINEAGGVNGVKLKLIFEDDEADGAKTKSAYETLMDKAMQILVGAVTSDSSIAINDLVAKDGILQVTPSASAIEANVNPNTFRVCFTDPLQGKAMAEYTYGLGYTKAAVIHNQDDNYSTGMYQAFVERFKELGGTISEDVSFAKDASDFNAQVTKIKASDADFIFMPIYAEKAAQIVITLNEKEVNLPLFGGDGLDGILNYLTGDNAKLVEGLVYLTPFVSTDSAENVKSFTEKYTQKYGSAPDQFAADAYDAVYLVKLALEKAGVTSAAELDNAKLVEAMHSVELDGLTGHMTFDADGEPQKDAKVAKIVNGQYVAQ